MITNKFSAMYYPSAFIENRRSVVTFSLFFDEINMVTFSDLSKDPTNYLKSLPDKIEIGVIGKSSDEQMEKVGKFYCFALDYKALFGNVITYHPHAIDSMFTSLSTRLISGNSVPIDELWSVLTGNSDEMKSYNKFIEDHPEISDEIVFRVAPTALKLAEKNDWILISDNSLLPVPLFEPKKIETKHLTSIIAEECINIALPECHEVYAEEILEAREKLNDLLVPFRFSMQKLTSSLRSNIKDAKDIIDVKQEAKIYAQSNVEPALYELQRKIELDRNKLIVKIFGKVLGWVPLIANSFIAPTPDKVYSAMAKAYGDVSSLTENAQDIAISREPGISYLLGVNKIQRKM